MVAPPYSWRPPLPGLRNAPTRTESDDHTRIRRRPAALVVSLLAVAIPVGSSSAKSLETVDSWPATVAASTTVATFSPPTTLDWTSTSPRGDVAVCGNGIVDTGEECDDGASNGALFCDQDCDTTCGDVDCSGTLVATDALRVLSFAVGLPIDITCSPDCGVAAEEAVYPPLACADINCDESVTATDALSVLRRAIAQPVPFQCGFACHGSVCGDGILCDGGWNCTSGPGGGVEECDDGNTVEDDGCTSDCAIMVSPCNGALDDPSPEPLPRDVEVDAGTDQEVLRGQQVDLSGMVTAPDGSTPELCWTLESRPEGSNATLSDRMTDAPSFFADVAGDYVLALRAQAGDVVSNPARITVSARTVRTPVDAGGEFLVSADHALTMEVPAGAVDSETEISIELLRPEDMPEELRQAEPAAAYEFGPDGMEFDQPLDFTWRSAPDPDDAPIVPIATDGTSFTDADNAITYQSADGIEARWSAEHFSGAALLRLRSINLKIDGPVVAGVGHRFEIHYTASAAFGPAGFTATTRREGAFATEPQILPPLPAFSVVSDLRYDTDLGLALPGTPVSTGVFSGVCVDTGVVQVGVQVELSSNALLTLLPTGSFSRNPVVQLSAQVRCTDSTLPPVATDDSVFIGFGAGGITVSPLGNDFDPDGQLDPASIEILQQPPAGSATPNADGTVTVILGGRLRLTDAFRYRVSDTDGFVSNPATVFLRRFAIPNSSPVLVADTARVGRNTPADLLVLANDTDADGVLDPGSVQITRIPDNGTAMVNADGSIHYEPDFDYLGADSLEYQAADNNGATGTAVVVDIDVVTTTPPPVAEDDSSSTLEEQPVDIDVLANDSGDIDPTSLEITSTPFTGTAEIIAPAMGDPVIRYTPVPAFNGPVSFFYRVANSDGLFSGNAQVTLFVMDPNNMPPVAGDDMTSTPVNTPVDVIVSINDQDPDGFLTIGTEEIVDPPLHGMAARQSFGVFRYTPDTDFIGTDTFTYRIADDQNAFSNTALVTIDVFDPPNIDPVAANDRFVVSPDEVALLPVLLNDSDSDGTIDPTTVTIVTQPMHGTAVAQADGRIQYEPTASFEGDDSLEYRVADDEGGLSNTAMVEILVRDFEGVDGNPLDNISAAQVHFFSRFGSVFIDQGIGGFFGFNHADASALANLMPISDYTWWFEGNPDTSEEANAASFTMQTDLQTGNATFDSPSGAYAINGFAGAALFPDVGGTLTVEPAGGGTQSSVGAPPTLLDGQGDPIVFRGAFDRFRTEVQFPDGQFTHMLLRAVEFRPPDTLRGVLLRVPASAMELDTMTGMRHRQILDDLAATTVEGFGFSPTSGVAVVFYNQVDNSAYFDAPGQRTVPLAAGRGVSIPGPQMAAEAAPCSNLPTNVECEGGPREVLLAVNGNGSVTMHSPMDGSLLGDFLGGDVPNFTILGGWQIVQDPATNCLLFSDDGNDKIAKYDTDGSLIDGTYITTAGGASTVMNPRGMAFRGGELLVADYPLSRILRFDAAGAFLGELATGIGQPNGIYVAGDGDVLFSDDSQASGQDRVRLLPADGGPLRDVIATGLGTPYQITRMLDGNLALANFGANEIRIFDDGFPTIASVTVGTNPSAGGNVNPRGIWPLENGNWLATLSNGGGVAVLDPEQMPTAYVNTEEPGSSFRFISSVCVPE